jgi:hypothetical protein
MDSINSIKYEMINLIRIVSDTINNYNNLIIKRTRKIDLANILHVLCRKIFTGMSFNNVICNMKIHKFITASKEAFIKKRSQLSEDLLKNLIETILNKIVYKNNQVRVIAVDGTHVILDKRLHKDGFKLNDKKNYCTGLISGVYDIKNNIPINYKLVTHGNERDVFIQDQLKYINRDDIVIFDRGYYSNELVKILSDKGIKFVFRVKNELKMVKQLIKEKENDINYNVKFNKFNIPVRCIRYIIHLTEDQKKYHYHYPESGEYYICTNLDSEFTIEKIINLYHDRWSIETNFRYAKYNLTLSEIKSKKLLNVKQDILIHNFILIYTGYIYMLITKLNKKMNTKINYSNVITQLCENSFLKIFLYGKLSTRNINFIVHLIMCLKNVTYIAKKGRKFKRIRLKPQSKWGLYGNIYAHR